MGNLELYPYLPSNPETNTAVSSTHLGVYQASLVPYRLFLCNKNRRKAKKTNKRKNKNKNRASLKNSCRLDVCLANLVYLFHPKLSQFFFYNKDIPNFFFFFWEGEVRGERIRLRILVLRSLKFLENDTKIPVKVSLLYSIK